MLGKVYQISSPNSEKVYIGSTFKTLQERFRRHLKCSNQTTSKVIIDSGEAFIELLEEVKVIDKNELRVIEQQYLELYKDIAVNRYYAFGKDKARKKEVCAEYYEANKAKIAARGAKYREKNKDKIVAKNADYREKNKDKIAARDAEYKKKNSYKILCICGTSVTKTNMPRHIKSIKHLKYIAQ